MTILHTTLGAFESTQLGMILPHEHIFVDLRTPDTPGQGQAPVEDVVRLMAPELERARALGVTALVECTPEGVGRRVDLVKAVSQAAEFSGGGRHRHLPRAVGPHLGAPRPAGCAAGLDAGRTAGGHRPDGCAGWFHQAQRRR